MKEGGYASDEFPGAEGERLAVGFLRKLGYEIIRRNFRTRFGEVDIIARDGDEVVFVEVRSRSRGDWELLEQSVTLRKQQRISRAAAAFARRTRAARPLRFDVIAVKLCPDGEPEFRHYKDAFTVPPAGRPSSARRT
jgi:putative endonuclease